MIKLLFDIIVKGSVLHGLRMLVDSKEYGLISLL